MACVTLKRSHQFDPLTNGGLSPKKRRCHGPATQTFVPAPIQNPESPFVTSSTCSTEHLALRIRQEVKRLQRRRLIPRFNLNGSLPMGTSNEMGSQSDSSDSEGCSSPPGPSRSGALTSTLGLPFNSLAPSPSGFLCGDQNNSSLPGCRSPVRQDTPLFTLRQVNAICDRLVHEREDQVREDYDRILSGKLAEQYEAFLKFNHDQLCKRFQNAPISYVS